MRRPAAVLLTVLALGALGACGDDEGDDEAAPAPQTRDEEGASTTPGTPSNSPGGAQPGQVPRPSPDSCQPVAESPDGVYTLAGIGTVTVRLAESGSGLSVDVESTGGWGTTVDSDDDEADIEFARDGEEVDFEVDVEGGRLVIQVCDDDD